MAHTKGIPVLPVLAVSLFPFPQPSQVPALEAVARSAGYELDAAQALRASFQRIAVNMDMHGGEASIEAAVKQILRRLAPLKQGRRDSLPGTGRRLSVSGAQRESRNSAKSEELPDNFEKVEMQPVGPAEAVRILADENGAAGKPASARDRRRSFVVEF